MAKYNHQPDFDNLVIVGKPDNDNPDRGQVLVSAMCVCGDGDHAWTGSIYGGEWSANKHVSEIPESSMKDGWPAK